MRKAIAIVEERKEESTDILVKESGSTVMKAQQKIDLSIAIIRLAADFPFAPALATGNTVVVNPSSSTPVSGVRYLRKSLRKLVYLKVSYKLLFQRLQKLVMPFMSTRFLK